MEEGEGKEMPFGFHKETERNERVHKMSINYPAICWAGKASSLTPELAELGRDANLSMSAVLCNNMPDCVILFFPAPNASSGPITSSTVI